MSGSDFNALFAKNLNYLLKMRNMTQAELAERMGVSTATTSNWCKGIKLPRMDKVDKMCAIFDCLRSDLMEDKGYLQGKKKSKGIVINVYGRVAAGIPLEMIEDIIDTEEITEEMARTGEFFGLRIKGDSMSPDICNNDIVIVRQQDDAESGDIVIATINGNEATCKRLRKYRDGIELISINPSYDIFSFSNQEILEMPVKIIGKVVESRRKFSL
ncbi:MAG: XRE family transcriptional regulator [Dorea phocaeensis]